MKTKLIIILIVMLVIMGISTADPVDMTIYDRNNDGKIDTTERIALDIDIEDSRLTQNESRIIDSYTIDNTLLLTEEFQKAFLSPDLSLGGYVETVPAATPEPTIEPTVESTLLQCMTDDPTPEPNVEVNTTIPVTDTTQKLISGWTILMILMIIVIVLYGIYIRSNEKD